MAEPATILLVEDDKALLNGIADLLEVSDIGYDINVLTAADGVGGLNILSERLPDLIVSDITMPRMGGYEFLSQVRKNPKWLHIPFIFLTARGTQKDIREGRLSGAELYVTKPYDSDELLKLIQSQLDRAIQLELDRQRRITLLRRNIVQVLNHEFRTPLTYVTAYYDLLAEGLFSEDVTILWQYLRGIQAGASRLKRLVNDLITVIELRTGELAARFSQQAELFGDLASGMRALCERYRVANEGRDLTFSYQIIEPLPVLYGHPDLLLDACDRLIDNAVKFSIHRHGNARVRVSVKAANSEVRIAVQDNGVGLPDGEQNQIFDLFYQHNRPVLEQQGAGIGLTIARGLVELHRGRIEVVSREGIGSSFTIILPINGSHANELLGEPSRTESSRMATLLLVEDQVNLLNGMADLLELYEGRYNFTVIPTTDGHEALEILDRRSVDLIISDIMMPTMSGYQLLKEVRSRPELVHIPFIFLTAKSERQDIIHGLGSGVEEYITKPYDDQELYDLVCAQLDRYGDMQNLIRSDFEELKRRILDVLLPGLQIPLEAVTEYSDKLAGTLDAVVTEKDLLTQLMGIQAGSNQLTRLAEDFIFLAEMQTGEARKSFKLRAQRANAALIFDQVSQEYNRRNEPYTLEFERHINLDLSPVNLDQEMMWNCFERLIEVVSTIGVRQIPPEAGDEPDRHHRIILESYSEGSDVCICVSSRDSHISTEQTDQIGLLLACSELVVLELSGYSPGLIIVKGVVDLHDGWMFIENRLERGFTFKIILPSGTSETSPLKG